MSAILIPTIHFCKKAVKNHIKSLKQSSDLDKFSLLFIDINRLKIINETLSYDVGDKVLGITLKRLQMHLEKEDIFRWGGDEFVILLKNTSSHEAVLIAEDLLELLKVPITINDEILHITVNIGVSTYPEHGVNEDSLLNHVEVALSKAKIRGRNEVCLFDPSMVDKANILKIENALYKAITNNELYLVYQPRVDLETNTILGVETLVRWVHPTIGFIPPDQFIPIAEDTGLIKEVDLWVLENALKQLKKWHEMGFSQLLISVNMSTENFYSSNLVSRIEKAISESKVNPSNVELEITESLFMNKEESIIETLNYLKGLGITIAVDDFGTGYSSLSYLQNFPVNALKIDKSFISTIYTGATTEVVSAIIQLGHSLNLKVVAEGIETEEQCSLLKSFLCDEGQGYFFSRPITAEEVESMLQQQLELKKVDMQTDGNEIHVLGECIIQAKEDIYYIWKMTREIAIQCEFNEGTAMKLQLAIEEACMNAFEYCMIHGFRKIAVMYRANSLFLEIFIKHESAPFSLRQYRGINKVSRGKGLSLIIQLVDEVEVFSENNQITFYIRKNFE